MSSPSNPPESWRALEYRRWEFDGVYYTWLPDFGALLRGDVEVYRTGLVHLDSVIYERVLEDLAGRDERVRVELDTELAIREEWNGYKSKDGSYRWKRNMDGRQFVWNQTSGWIMCKRIGASYQDEVCWIQDKVINVTQLQAACEKHLRKTDHAAEPVIFR